MNTTFTERIAIGSIVLYGATNFLFIWILAQSLLPIRSADDVLLNQAAVSLLLMLCLVALGLGPLRGRVRRVIVWIGASVLLGCAIADVLFSCVASASM